MTSVFQVDTFTREPFHGNPAAVCVNREMPDAAWMQAVAAELRMPATAFVAGDGSSRQLRWFTPTTELEICGHGTLAATHILWETETREHVEFTTPAGAIAARREGDSSFITLEAGEVAEAEPLQDLVAALGTTPAAVWRTPLDFLVELESPTTVVAVTPDFELLERVDTRGVIVTAQAGNDAVDFTSRFFAPRLGLPEDSVTGSAHASLAPYWGKRLGKTSLRARQASSRGGSLDLRLRDGLVDVGGPAITVAQGQLRVEPT
jgi:PhzF family phenazine biosynthesis protein